MNDRPPPPHTHKGDTTTEILNAIKRAEVGPDSFADGTPGMCVVTSSAVPSRRTKSYANAS